MVQDSKIARSAAISSVILATGLSNSRAEPLLDLRADLRAQPEREPAFAEQLMVDRLVGEVNRVARKRDCDVGHQVEAADGRRQRERREDIVRSLEGEHPARPGVAEGPRLLDRIRWARTALSSPSRRESLVA